MIPLSLLRAQLHICLFLHFSGNYKLYTELVHSADQTENVSLCSKLEGTAETPTEGIPKGSL